MSMNMTLVTHEFLLLASVLDTDIGLPSLVEALEWEVLEIGLHLCVIEFAADKTLGVKNTEWDEIR